MSMDIVLYIGAFFCLLFDGLGAGGRVKLFSLAAALLVLSLLV